MTFKSLLCLVTMALATPMMTPAGAGALSDNPAAAAAADAAIHSCKTQGAEKKLVGPELDKFLSTCVPGAATIFRDRCPCMGGGRCRMC